MSKLLHIKGSRVKVLSSLPTNSFGDDGDIVLSSIKGKGAYLCAKMNGRWHVANKLEDLKKMERTSIRDLKVDKLRIGNATLTKDEYDKPVGNFTLDVGGDIILSADGGDITMSDGTLGIFEFNTDNCTLRIHDDADVADYFNLQVGASGATTIATVDDGATVGHLKLVPDGDLILDPASKKTIISATDGLYFDGGTHTYIIESGTDNLRFVVGGVTLIDLTEDTVSSVNVRNAALTIAAGKKLFFDGSTSGHTCITESSADVLDFYVGADKMLALDEANDKITMGATNWVAGTVSGATVTEFSAANSAYAGMILGYTDIGLNESHTLLSLTTSFVVPTDEFSVSFVAPPSGKVEIQCQIQHGFGSGGLGDLLAGISTANATSGYSGIVGGFHEKMVNDVGTRGGVRTIQISWTLTGLTAGTAYERWVGFKTPTTSGSPFIQWGGSGTGRYPDFIMKAIALPATITT